MFNHTELVGNNHSCNKVQEAKFIWNTPNPMVLVTPRTSWEINLRSFLHAELSSSSRFNRLNHPELITKYPYDPCFSWNSLGTLQITLECLNMTEPLWSSQQLREQVSWGTLLWVQGGSTHKTCLNYWALDGRIRMGYAVRVCSDDPFYCQEISCSSRFDR